MLLWYLDERRDRRELVQGFGVEASDSVAAWRAAWSSNGRRPGLLVIHGGNFDVCRVEGEGGLCHGGQLLVDTIRDVLVAGGRAVVFSGISLHESVDLTAVRQSLTEYRSGRDYLLWERGIDPVTDIPWKRLAVAEATALSSVIPTYFLGGSPASSREVLAALAVLCQGYLAAQVASGHPVPRIGDNDPMDRMGWYEFAKLPASADILASISGQDKRVAEAKWWLDVFEDVDAAVRQAEEEWTPDKPGLNVVLNLLKSLKPRGVVDTNDVVGAFIALCDEQNAG